MNVTTATSNETRTMERRGRLPRISEADALAMYRDLSIHELGRLAFERLERVHPQPYRTYVVDRNINYANVCTATCIFCNFYRKPGADGVYILTYEQIGKKIEELIEIGGTQILMQGGLAPDEKHASGQGLPFEWYLDLLRFIKKNYPSIHIHAFSPPEIWAFHKVFDMPLRDVLLRLRDAGLDTMPGGGGEILADRVRRKIGQGKTLTDEWLAVCRAAHKLGIKSSCTMMFGHIETVEERIEHLRLLRDLQDETGGFTAFIHWTFQPVGTPLGRWKPMGESSELRVASSELGRSSELRVAGSELGRSSELRVKSSELQKDGGDPSELITLNSELATPPLRPVPDGEHLLLADAHEYLVMLAIARLYLDNIPNIQSSWVTMGPKIGQLALFYGANDMGSVMMEENVVSAAGATFRLDEEQIRRLITDAGWQPQQRDQYYRPIETRRKRMPLPVAHTPDSTIAQCEQA